jgi:TolA-binding protein
MGLLAGLAAVVLAALPLRADDAKPVTDKPAAAVAPAPAASGQSSMSSYFNSLWSRLKTMTTISATGSGSRTTAVAGLRGAKQGEESLSPYWKGDVPEDATPDQADFSSIRNLVDKNDFAAAETELIAFRQAHGSSPLRPHADVTLAMCQMQLGKFADARTTLESFLATYADHELAPQARSMQGMIADAEKSAATAPAQ